MPVERRYRNRRRAVTLIFVVVSLPLIFLGLAISTDATLMIVRGRAVSNSVNMAALAGARQTQAGKRTLDTAHAANVARFAMALDASPGQHNVLRGITVLRTRAYAVNTPQGYGHVSASMTYRVNRLLVTPIIATLTGKRIANPTVTITRHAFVCDTLRTSDPTRGRCIRPT